MTLQLTGSGRARLLSAGIIAATGAASVAAPVVTPANPPPVVGSGGPLASLTFYQPMPCPSQAQYQVTIGRIIVSGGTGPYAYSATSNNGRYLVNAQTGIVTIPSTGDITLSADTITVTVNDALGGTLTAALPVVKRADTAPSIFISHLGLDDANVTGNPFTKQSLLAFGYGGDHTGKDVITYTVGGPSATLFGVQYGILGPVYAGPGPVPAGSYPIHITAKSATETLTVDYNWVINPVPAIGAFSFVPGIVSTSQPAGTYIATALATTPTNGRAWSVTGTDAQYFTIVANTGVFSLKALAPVGAKSINLTCTDNVATRTEAKVINVVQGNVLPPTNMTLTAAPIDNYARNQVVGTPQVVGITGTPAWTVQFAEYYRGGYNLDPLFAINPTTGVIAAPGQLDAYPYQVTCIVTDGINTCTQVLQITPVWVANAKTLHVGQGMVAQYGAGIGFEHLVDVQELCRTTNLGVNAGAEIMIHYNSNPNYYAEDNGGGQNGSTLGVGYLRIQDGWNGPLKFTGVRGPNGERPRLGGTLGSPSGGFDLSAKGFFNLQNGQMILSDLHISNVLGRSINGTEAMSGIRKNADTFGSVTVQRCLIHDCDNGLLGGVGPYRITMDSNEIGHCGTSLDGEGHGPSHGSYIGHCIEVIYTNNLTYDCTYGHNLKTRARAGTITGNRIYDGERGTASCNIDIPSGGAYVITGNKFHKGPNSQAAGSIRYAAEYDYSPTSTDAPVLTCKVDGNLFYLADCGGTHFGSFACVHHFVQVSPFTGLQSAVTFSNNNVYMTSQAPLFSETYGANYGSVAHTITSVNTTMLTAPPALDFTHPGPADPSIPRLGFIQFLRDGGDTYKNTYGVQIDVGSDDMRLPVNAAAGTVLGNCQAFGANAYRNASLTDPRINPFGTGTVYSITFDPEYFSTPAWAPSGRYVIDSASGALTVGTGPRATSGVDFVKIRATGPTGVLCDTRIYVSVG